MFSCVYMFFLPLYNKMITPAGHHRRFRQVHSFSHARREQPLPPENPFLNASTNGFAKLKLPYYAITDIQAILRQFRLTCEVEKFRARAEPGWLPTSVRCSSIVALFPYGLSTCSSRTATFIKPIYPCADASAGLWSPVLGDARHKSSK
jgi:hypothetical protein